LNNNRSLWERLLSYCLAHRLRKSDFQPLCKQLWSESPVSAKELTETLLNCQDGLGPVADPLLPIYLEVLLLDKDIRVDTANILDALYTDSRYCPEPVKALEETLQRRQSRKMTNDLDSRVFIRLLHHFVSGKLPTLPHEAVQVLKSLSKWMIAIPHYFEVMQVLDHDGLAACDGLGLLVISVLENLRMISIIDQACPKGSY
jgi:hypothetical protein